MYKFCEIYVKFITKLEKEGLLGMDGSKKRGPVIGCRIDVKRVSYDMYLISTNIMGVPGSSPGAQGFLALETLLILTVK